MKRMANSYFNKPSRQWSGRKAAAVAFALTMTAVWQPALVVGQIEVDVLTSASKSADTNSSAPATSSSDLSVLKQDKSADEAAQRILPAPGTEMQSTENSSLATEAAVAQEPSLKLNADQATMSGSGDSTETMAVRSGVELLQMLGLRESKAATVGGGELDEETSSPLFDVDAIRKLKGSDPTVVYRVVVDKVPMPDPMIVPWIRQAKLLQERFDRAVSYLADNRVDDGRQELMGIITDFPESDYAKQAKAILTKLDDIKKSEIPTPVMKDETVETVSVRLSPNIHVGAVIVDPASPAGNRAMIEGRAYKVGDAIRGEDGHTVVSISDQTVQIEVEQSGVKKIFDIPVRPNAVNN